jgi:hypothetical protein
MSKTLLRAIALIIFVILTSSQVFVTASQAFGIEETPEDRAKKAKEKEEFDRKIEAMVACQPAIERLAKYDYRWTDSFFNLRSKFDRGKIGEDEVLLGGDDIEFQTGFGTWMRQWHICVYDRKTKTVTKVLANTGRWPEGR